MHNYYRLIILYLVLRYLGTQRSLITQMVNKKRKPNSLSEKDYMFSSFSHCYLKWHYETTQTMVNYTKGNILL